MRHDECSPEPRLVPKTEEEEASNVRRMLSGETSSISWNEARKRGDVYSGSLARRPPAICMCRPRRSGTLQEDLISVLMCIKGYDRPYDDLPGMPITLAQGSDATACAKLCQQNTDCVAWVFSTPEQGCSSPYLCWLKNPLPPLVCIFPQLFLLTEFFVS